MHLRVISCINSIFLLMDLYLLESVKWISWQTFSFLFGWLLANYSLISMKMSEYWKLSCMIANWEVIAACFEEPISHLCVIYFWIAWNLVANESFIPLAVSH